MLRALTILIALMMLLACLLSVAGCCVVFARDDRYPRHEVSRPDVRHEAPSYYRQPDVRHEAPNYYQRQPRHEQTTSPRVHIWIEEIDPVAPRQHLHLPAY